MCVCVYIYIYIYIYIYMYLTSQKYLSIVRSELNQGASPDFWKTSSFEIKI